MDDILLKEIMISNVITAHYEESLSRIEEKFRVRGVRHVPILDETRRVVGMFTRNDLAKCLAPHRTEDGLVYDKDAMNEFVLKYVMTPEPTVLGPEDRLSRAVEIMARNKYGCIPIVGDHGTLLGIVTQVDVMKFLLRALKS
ncbi:MAG: CBS domain-containing protein [Candidatus Omnitrophica bacterium]|nr:CBS domain-containing protein [Candidatus Omnitrophota bacterium]